MTSGTTRRGGHRQSLRALGVRLRGPRRLPFLILAAAVLFGAAAAASGRASPAQALLFTAALALAAGGAALAQRRTEAVLAAEIARRREAEQEAHVADRAKSEFLAKMSHELRTPLSAVIGTADLLLGAGLAPDQHRHVEVITSSAESLLALIDDTLDFAKLEAGRLRLEAVDFRLRELVERVCELVAPVAAEKGIELDVEVDAGVPDALHGDPSRLRQILLNLVGNALKFTARGWVEIRVAEVGAAEEAPRERATRIHFAVRDTGIGISPRDQRRIFETFYQADSISARRFAGSGLGLAISKQLIVRMGGEIGLESERGAGSTFWFRLPLVPARGELPAPGTGGGETGDRDPGTRRDVDRGRFRVLVVDDNTVSRRLALAHLEAAGYRTAEAADGRSALSRLEAERFDAVLMDCQLPNLDGYETARRWRRSEAERAATEGRARRTPVIAVTAHAIPGEREKCLAVGMDDYLAKPYRGAELRALLDRWLRPDAEGAAAGAAAAIRAPDFEERVAALGRLGEKTGQDVLGPAIAEYSNDRGKLLGRMSRALAGGDAAAVAQAAHALLASSGALGARHVVDLLREIGARALEGEFDGLDQLLDAAEAESERFGELLATVEP